MADGMFSSETLDTLLDELTDLATSSPLSVTFFHSILEAAIRATCAEAGAVWSVVGPNYRLEQEVGLVRLGIGSDSQLQAFHEDALELATKRQFTRNASTELVQRTFGSNEFRFFGCRDRDLAYLVIELVHREGAIHKSDFASLEAFMAALSEIARDFRNAQALRRLQSEEDVWGDFKSTLPILYSSIRIDESAYLIANEGRRFLGCDRLSVFGFDGERASIIAVSGVSTIEKRAKQVRELESLVRLSAKSGIQIRYPTEAVEVETPQISEGLHRYLDVAQCERIEIRLMFDTRSTKNDPPSADAACVGALAIEFFGVTESPELDRRCDLLLQHAAIAFRNAMEYDRLPLRRLSESLLSWKTYTRKNRLGIAATVAATIFLVGIAIVFPADLNITAKGTIQPMRLRHLYAPANGEVVRIHAAHQSKVQEGAQLLELRSRELELRKEELLTLYATTQEKLRSIEVARLQNRKATQADAITSGDLSASENELREVLASQEEQLSILNDMIASLQVTSPMAGQVISWDPTETLDHRPVQQGQKLVSVAELGGEGRLQLRVLDEDTRHVIKAYERSDVPLRVTFSVASDPGIQHSAIVNQIGTTIETVTTEGATLRIDAKVDAAEMTNVRPGATVNAKIHCGRASLGYVWTRRLWDFLAFHFV